MEKELKVIHINDGSKEMLTNGNFHFAEELSWTGKVLSAYVNAGFQIVSVMTDYTPYPEHNSFFKTGFNVILEREVRPDNIQITEEDWRELNPSREVREEVTGEEDDIDLLEEDDIDLDLLEEDDDIDLLE